MEADSMTYGADISSQSIQKESILRLSGWRKFLLWFVCWTLIGVLQSARLYYIYSASEDSAISWPVALSWSLAEWYIWGIFSILIIRITAKVGFGGEKWALRVFVHLIIGLAVGAIAVFLYSAAYKLIQTYIWTEVAMGESSVYEIYCYLIRSKLFYAVLTYFLIAFVSYAISYYKRFRDEERRLMKAEAKLANAQLQALKTQLHPHFLFNALNAIATLVHTDPEAADRMIARLSELLRITLDNQAIQEVPLEREVEFLERYLDIQKIRFQDRLQVQISTSAAALEAMVPNLILQPLVENSIRHGISKQTEGGEIRITVERHNDTLRMEVADTGPGLDKDWETKKGGGHGLFNTRERLAQLYGDRHSFSLKDGSPKGLIVTIDIPYRIKTQTNQDV
jgi:sensor histidine kinase YesM